MSIFRRVILGSTLVAGALTIQLSAVAQKAEAPSADALRKIAGQYVESYGRRVSGVSLDELFMLIETSGGQTRVPLRIASDVILVALDKQIVGLRDPYAIDTRKLREHEPRIVQLLKEPTQANVNLAQQQIRANAIQLQHNVVIWYSDPMLAMQFMAAVNQPNLTYKVDGDKKMNGVQVYGVSFKEGKDGPRILNTIPGNAQSSGRFWIDAATGAIHMTELWVQSDTDIVRVKVTFAPDAKLGLVLPRSAAASFEWREFGNRNTNPVGTAPIKLSFEANAEYKNPQYTPIDLTRGGM